jgi:hypothetical protein
VVLEPNFLDVNCRTPAVGSGGDEVMREKEGKRKTEGRGSARVSPIYRGVQRFESSSRREP